MALFETLVALLLVSALLLQVSRRLKAPYPTMLALAGACVAASPWAPKVGIDPHLALALFISPAIFVTAYDTSPYDLRRNWLPLVALAVFAVVLTCAAVAWAAWALAGLPLAAAIALGAIVAPPDTAAASAVLANTGLPRRTMVILQGESLLNDAVALLIFAAAVAIAEGATASPVGLAARLAIAAPGGILLGLACGYLWARGSFIWAGSLSTTIVEFSGAFAVWLVAERLGVSPILAMVAFAMQIAQSSPSRQPARDRVHSYAVWDAAVFVLNVLAFLLMGLQARAILERLQGPMLWNAVGFAAGVFAIVVVVRIVWVMSYRLLFGPLSKAVNDTTRASSNPRVRLLVAWCGMRGILTLATALSLPADFAGRDLIVLSAFTVVLGTLIVQGSTIGLLIRWLKIEPDTSFEDDLAIGRTVMARAGLTALEGRDGPQAEYLRGKLNFVVAKPEDPDAAEETGQGDLRRDVVAAQRKALVDLHRQGALPEDAFQALQEDLDWSDLSTAPRATREMSEG